MVNNINDVYKVVIVILCHNSKRWLHNCIETVMKTNYNNFHVVLIDNASADGSIKEFEGKYANLTIIRNEENIGWCKGNNQGIQYAIANKADFVYLSNSDVAFFDRNWLIELIRFKRVHDKYMIIGPLQYEYNNDQKINTWSKYILENGNRNVHYMWSKHITSKNKRYNYSLERRENEKYDVYFVQGAAMLIDIKLIYKIGLFDDLYFIFFDELDFCRRCLRIGDKVALVPTSKIKHYGSGDNSSSKKMQTKRNFYYSRNKYYYILSDYNLKKKIRNDILRRWILDDFRKCFQKNSDVSNFGQLLHIFFDIQKSRKKLIEKRKKEKKMEQQLIKEKLVECMSRVAQDFTIEKFECNLQEDFGLDSIAIMELMIYIEEEFEMEFGEDVELQNLYSPLFILNYIINREI